MITGWWLTPSLGTDIEIGEHVQVHVAGLTFNADVIWATVVALAVVIALGLVLRRRTTSGVPNALQCLWEMIVEATTRQIEGSIGEAGRAVIPLAVTLFIFIFTANSFEIFGLGAKDEWLIPPTADINLPLAMALFVIVLVHVSSIRVRGFGGYIKHYFAQPFPAKLFPINAFMNFVEELAKPVTLTLRLFGNLVSGVLMLTLIAALGVWTLGSIPIGNVLVLIFNPVWKLFDLAIGGIQAFIFALLTILYFDTAMSSHDEELEVEGEPKKEVPPAWVVGL